MVINSFETKTSSQSQEKKSGQSLLVDCNTWLLYYIMWLDYIIWVINLNSFPLVNFQPVYDDDELHLIVGFYYSCIYKKKFIIEYCWVCLPISFIYEVAFNFFPIGFQPFHDYDELHIVVVFYHFWICKNFYHWILLGLPTKSGWCNVGVMLTIYSILHVCPLIFIVETL